MSGFYGQYLKTVGLEYESVALTIRDVTKRVLGPLQGLRGDLSDKISVTRDASTEFRAELLNLGGRNLTVSTHTELYGKISNKQIHDQLTMGFELVTVPMEVSELESLVYPMMMYLQAAGDFTSMRAAVHFHVGFANNLRLLKNLLMVNLNLEPVLYRLGGMGGTYRGCSNISAYSRPLMNSAAVIIGKSSPQTQVQGMMDEFSEEESQLLPISQQSPNTMQQLNQTQQARDRLLAIYAIRRTRILAKKKGNIVQIINPMAALSADSIEKFWAAFGVGYRNYDGNKYHPCRYSACNFYSVPQHGTFEYRHFNQTLDPVLIMAVAKFLRGTVEMSTMLTKSEIPLFEPLDSNQEIQMPEAVKIVEKIMGLCYEKEVEDLPSESEIALIFETLENSRFLPIPETPVMTHKEFYLDARIAELGGLKYVEETLPANYTDIHNIDKKFLSLYDEGELV